MKTRIATQIQEYFFLRKYMNVYIFIDHIQSVGENIDSSKTNVLHVNIRQI